MVARNLFQKSAHRTRTLAIGGLVAVAGGIVMNLYGSFGAVIIGVGLVVIGAGVLRGRRPLVTFDETRVVLQFAGAAQTVPFHTILKVVQTQTADIEISIRGGSKILVPLARLEEEDGAWLKKALRKEIRSAQGGGLST